MDNKLSMSFAVMGTVKDAKAVWDFAKLKLEGFGYTVHPMVKMTEVQGTCEVYFFIESDPTYSYQEFYLNVSNVSYLVVDTYDYIFQESIDISMGYTIKDIMSMNHRELAIYSFYSQCVNAGEKRKQSVALSMMTQHVHRLEEEIDKLCDTLRTSGCMNTFYLLKEMNNKFEEKGMPYIEMPEVVH